MRTTAVLEEYREYLRNLAENHKVFDIAGQSKKFSMYGSTDFTDQFWSRER